MKVCLKSYILLFRPKRTILPHWGYEDI